jgi:hypothetical protein
VLPGPEGGSPRAKDWRRCRARRTAILKIASNNIASNNASYIDALADLARGRVTGAAPLLLPK